MKRTFALLFLMTCCAPVVLAQSQTSDEYNKFEFYGGYSRNFGDTGDNPAPSVVDGRIGFNGFNASVTGNVTRYIGLKFEFSTHSKTLRFPIPGGGTLELDSRLNTYVGGLQLKDNSKSKRVFRPFAEALFGVAHATAEACVSGTTTDFDDIPPCGNNPNPPSPFPLRSTDNAFTAVIGGGIDLRASQHFSVRAFHFAYAPTRFGGSTQHNLRVGAGLVIH